MTKLESERKLERYKNCIKVNEILERLWIFFCCARAENYDRNFAAGKNGLLFHTWLGYSIKYAIKLTKPENKIRKIVVYCSY